jgi:hypothetical protein
MMPFDEQKVIDYLSEHYAGATATRALWRWAGGSQEEIDYRDAAQEQWSLMWSEARKMQGATPLSLMREALFDYPDKELLFGVLDALAEEDFPEWRETARLYLVQLEKLAPDFDLQALWAASQSMPALTADSHLAVIASTLRDLFSAEHRKVLKERFQALAQGIQTPQATMVVEGVQLILVHAIPELVMFEDEPQFVNVAAKIRSQLNAATEGFSATSMLEYMEDLRRVPAKSGNKELEAAASGIERQLACLEKMANQEAAPAVENISQAGIHLIWCTRGEAEEDEESPPAHEETHAEAGNAHNSNE